MERLRRQFKSLEVEKFIRELMKSRPVMQAGFCLEDIEPDTVRGVKLQGSGTLPRAVGTSHAEQHPSLPESHVQS